MCQEAVPVPGEGEFVDLNTTESCCSLGGGLGDNTQFCDTLARDARTLVVRRRTRAEMASVLRAGDSSWLESLGLVPPALLSEAAHPCEHCARACVLITSIMTLLCSEAFKS